MALVRRTSLGATDNLADAKQVARQHAATTGHTVYVVDRCNCGELRGVGRYHVHEADTRWEALHEFVTVAQYRGAGNPPHRANQTVTHG